MTMMRGVSRQLAITLRLHFRNLMALVYGYAFPLIFLIAFAVLYRYERVPLVRHVGELLTIAVLGGACFGLPTTMVSDRERGVWRRYRLTPVPTASLVASTVAARYVILVTAGVLQLALAMAIGMPLPQHPFELLVAFTFVSFAFLGLGLVIAMLADNVPAVQALGQCIFLPMLIIGGVAVQLSALPEWAQHLSAFFPGRYAVEAIQATVNGNGLNAVRFSLFALTIIGLAGCIAAAKMFRWDSRQRFASIEGKGWMGVALGAWVAVGALAEFGGQIPILRPEQAAAPQEASLTSPTRIPMPPAPAPGRAPLTVTPTPSEVQAESETGNEASADAQTGGSQSAVQSAEPQQAAGPRAPAARGDIQEGRDQGAATGSNAQASSSRDGAATDRASGPAAAGSSGQATPERAAADGRPSEPGKSSGAASSSPGASSGNGSAGGAQPSAPGELPEYGPPTWQQVTMAYIEADIIFDGVPPDNGVVTPVASLMDEPDPDTWAELDILAAALPDWAPGKVQDPVQRVRNLLFVAAVPDVFQIPMESFAPLIVFQQIEASVPRDDLIKILYWIAIHPDQGDDSAVDQLRPLGLGNGPSDVFETRMRAAYYAVKLLGRITGKRPGR
jgi:hypothetical protein